MKNIAIITTKDRSYYDDYETIICSISDWSEVSDEDYTVLKSWCGRNNSYILLERHDKDPKFIPKLVKEFLSYAQEEAIKRQKEKEEAERKRAERELKKKAKTEKDELALLQTLQTKYAGKE